MPALSSRRRRGDRGVRTRPLPHPHPRVRAGEGSPQEAPWRLRWLATSSPPFGAWCQTPLSPIACRGQGGLRLWEAALSAVSSSGSPCPTCALGVVLVTPSSRHGQGSHRAQSGCDPGPTKACCPVENSYVQTPRTVTCRFRTWVVWEPTNAILASSGSHVGESPPATTSWGTGSGWLMSTV